MVEEYSLALPVAHTANAETDIAALVELYSALLFRVAHSVTRNRAEAEDVVQDTFVRVMERRQALPEIRDMRVWLVRITWNLALDRLRRIRPEQMDDNFARSLLGSSIPADQVFAEAQQIKAVLREIDRLPTAERQVLLLSAMQELSTAEVAQVMKKSESAIRALLFRARSRVKERLDNHSKGGKA